MPDLRAILAENDPERLLPELIREARQMRKEREGNDPSRLRELRKEARAMRLERRLAEKSEWLRRWR